MEITEQQWGFILGESLEAKKEALIQIISASGGNLDIGGLTASLTERMSPQNIDSLILAVSDDSEFLAAIGVVIPEPISEVPEPYAFSSTEIDALIGGSIDDVRSLMISVHDQVGFDSFGSGLVFSLGSNRLGDLLNKMVPDELLWQELNFPRPTTEDINSITASYVPFSRTIETIKTGGVSQKKEALLQVFSEAGGLEGFISTLTDYFNDEQLSGLSTELASDQSFWSAIGIEPPSTAVATARYSARTFDQATEVQSLEMVGVDASFYTIELG